MEEESLQDSSGLPLDQAVVTKHVPIERYSGSVSLSCEGNYTILADTTSLLLD